MPLETGTNIQDLVPTNPTGTDPKGQGDDHIRLIKATIKNTFPAAADGSYIRGTASFTYENRTPAQVAGDIGAATLAGANVFTQPNQFPSIELGHASDTTLARIAAGRVSVEGAELARLSAAQEFTAAQQFTTIELGHATDTTLTRIAAGRVAIEDGEIAKLNASEPFTITQFSTAAGIGTSSSGRHWVFDQPAAPTDAKRWGLRTNVNGAILLNAYDESNALGGAAWGATRVGASGISTTIYGGQNRTCLVTQDPTVAPATTGATTRHADDNNYDVGMNVMPVRTVAAAITFARTDVGKILIKDEATARTWTTPASTDTDIPLGSTVNLLNLGSGAITIAAGSGVTLSRINGTGAAATGSRTLAQGGIATLYKRSATSWVIWGNLGLN